MKKKGLAQPSINGKFGWKYISHVERANGVESTFLNSKNQKQIVRSQYLVGADGGSSRVRKNASIKMLGQALPIALFLVHFHSQELVLNPPFGKCWHMFPPFGGFIIDQDDEGTFTAHMVLDTLDQDVSKIDPMNGCTNALAELASRIAFKLMRFSSLVHGGRISVLRNTICPPAGG